jgi:RHS repeat-associated protein
VETFAYDAADQLIQATLKQETTILRSVGYEYDLAGNRTTEQAVVGTLPQTTDYESLEFDAVNRVTAVIKGTRRSEFFYNGIGQRVRIVERRDGAVVNDKRYLWEGGSILEERDGLSSGVVTKRYSPLGFQSLDGAPTTYFYATDHLGSVREVSDANGNLVARYDYDPWGRRTQTFGDLKTDYGYAGYFIHQASGLNLTWFRAYDPDLGRWVSRDPISEEGGANLYGYVGNSPVNFNDPNGLQGEALAIGWGMALAEPTPFGEIAMLGVTAVVGIGIGVSYLASRPAPQSATPAAPASSAEPKEQEKAKNDTCGKPKKCLPCIPPVGTIAYRVDKPPSPAHNGIPTPHSHAYQMHQSPPSAGCRCFWVKVHKDPFPGIRGPAMKPAQGGGIAL